MTKSEQVTVANAIIKLIDATTCARFHVVRGSEYDIVAMDDQVLAERLCLYLTDAGLTVVQTENYVRLIY
jgi:hypothetical protein